MILLLIKHIIQLESWSIENFKNIHRILFNIMAEITSPQMRILKIAPGLMASWWDEYPSCLIVKIVQSFEIRITAKQCYF